MTPLILGVDSGLDGAFAWWSVGRIVKSVATRTIVRDRRIDMDALEDYSANAIFWAESLDSLRIAYIEEPFNNGVSGGASTSGYTDQCKRWGRLQGWLESWGYEVKGVQAKTWQREILDLGRFEVRTEKACAPRLADGWTMTRIKPTRQWRVRGPYAIDSAAEGVTRQDAIEDLGRHMPGAILRTKTVLSHDTKAASVAYVREHFPGVDLVPPRSKKPHDGLADAVCIAAWATKQLSKETP